MRLDRLAQRVFEPVRQGVIDRHRLLIGGGDRIGAGVIHSPDERCGHHQARRILMILHVILRRLSQDDVGLNVADHGGDPDHRRLVIEDLQIIKGRRMGGAARERGRCLRLFPPHSGGLFPRQGVRPTAPVGQVPEMNVAPRIFQAQDRP